MRALNWTRLVNWRAIDELSFLFVSGYEDLVCILIVTYPKIRLWKYLHGAGVTPSRIAPCAPVS